MNNKELVRVLRALGNERRFLIVGHLFGAKELTVSQISELIKLSFRSTSKHLGVLIGLDLIEKRQSSVNQFYSINKSRFPKEFIHLFTK